MKEYPTYQDVNGKTYHECLYAEGLMKEVGKADISVVNKGHEIYHDEILKAYELDSKLNNRPINWDWLISSVFVAGYIEGRKAGNKK